MSKKKKQKYTILIEDSMAEKKEGGEGERKRKREGQIEATSKNPTQD